MSLTPKQQAFANAIVEGRNPSEAYRLAYSCNRMSAAAISVEAQKLLKNPKISLVVEDAKAQAAENAKWSRQKAVERLQRVNDYTYSQITKHGLVSPQIASAFFNSLDRLNALCDVEAESRFSAPSFTFNRSNAKVNPPIIEWGV